MDLTRPPTVEPWGHSMIEVRSFFRGLGLGLILGFRAQAGGAYRDKSHEVTRGLQWTIGPYEALVWVEHGALAQLKNTKTTRQAYQHRPWKHISCRASGAWWEEVCVLS